MAASFPFIPTHWYYNTESGQLTQGNNLENLGNNIFGGLGWHELNIPGNATADQAAAEAKKEFPNGKPPTTAGITIQRIATNTAQDIIGSFNVGSWVLRIGEILLGLILVGVGIARITGAQNIVSKAVRTKI